MSNDVRRRDFLKKTLTGAVGAGAVVACGGPNAGGEGGPAVHTQTNVTWRLASSFPRALDTIFGSAEVLAERVEKMTGGRFKIRVYPAGELVPGLQVMDAAQQGTVQIGQTVSYYYTGKNPALAFDAAVPFGLTSRQQTAWLEQGGGRQLIDGLFSDFGIVTLPGGNTGAQMGGWFKREIESVEDLNGLKMRIPGLGGEVMSRLGSTVQVLAGGDIYPALERGAIDATEWVGPYDDFKLGFHRVAKFYYYPGWWEPGPSMSYLINRAAWDKLPKVYQEVLRSAAVESATAMLSRYDERNPGAFQQILAAGVQMRPFSDSIMQAARTTSEEMLEEQASADASYRKVYEHWKKAREASFQWFGTAELAYSKFAFPGA